MNDESPFDLGPRVASFEADLSRIRRGKVLVILLTVLFVGLFSIFAILGPPEEKVAMDPNKPILLRFVAGALAFGSIVIGVRMFMKVSCEAESRVTVYQHGMIVQ